MAGVELPPGYTAADAKRALSVHEHGLTEAQSLLETAKTQVEYFTGRIRVFVQCVENDLVNIKWLENNGRKGFD